jgi:hypothetical protein
MGSTSVKISLKFGFAGSKGRMNHSLFELVPKVAWNFLLGFEENLCYGLDEYQMSKLGWILPFPDFKNK